MIFYADGKFENYKIKSEPKADFKAVYKIEEKWTDNDGNIWYKYRLTEKSWDGLLAISSLKIPSMKSSTLMSTPEVPTESENEPKRAQTIDMNLDSKAPAMDSASRKTSMSFPNLVIAAKSVKS